MRSLPENRFWNNVKSRLENYSEVPDDNWDFIAENIPARNPGWSMASGNLFSVIALLSLLFLIDLQNGPGHVTSSVASGQQIIRHLEDDNHQNDGVNKKIDPAEQSSDSTAGSHGSVSGEGPVSRNANSQDERLEFLTANPKVSLPKRNDETGGMNGVSPVRPDSSAAVTAHTLSVTDFSASSDSSQLVEYKTRDTIPVMIANKSDKKRHPKFHSTVYVSITPSLGYYNIKPDHSDDLLLTGIHKKDMISTDRLGVQFDVGIQYKISSDFEMFGGISYYSQHQKFTFNYLTDEVGSIGSSGSMRYELAPAEAARSFRYSIRNFGITAGAFYVLKASRLSHRLGVGLQYEKGYLNYKSEGTHTRSQNDLLNFVIAYRLQAGLSRHMEWYIQPSFTQSVSEQRLGQEPFAIKPYRVGVGLGVLYRF